jgi:ADP-ribosyl-[dinitrogen reductase] hydrolase
MLAFGNAFRYSVRIQIPRTFKPVNEMIGGGSFNLKPEKWIGDTSLVLCLTESMKENRDLIHEVSAYSNLLFS